MSPGLQSSIKLGVASPDGGTISNLYFLRETLQETVVVFEVMRQDTQAWCFSKECSKVRSLETLKFKVKELMLLGEATEPLGGTALLKDVCHWGS